MMLYYFLLSNQLDDIPQNRPIGKQFHVWPILFSKHMAFTNRHCHQSRCYGIIKSAVNCSTINCCLSMRLLHTTELHYGVNICNCAILVCLFPPHASHSHLMPYGKPTFATSEKQHLLAQLLVQCNVKLIAISFIIHWFLLWLRRNGINSIQYTFTT